MGRNAARRWWKVVVVLVPLALAVSACGGGVGPHNRENSLRPVGRQAHTIDNLFTPVFWVAVAIGIFILGAVVYVAIRYRRRPGNENPPQVHGNTPLEIAWTLIPAVILAIIAVPTISTIFQLDKNPGPNALQVTVTAKQWWWQFSYPKQNGIDRPVVVADELHIPTGRDVHVSLVACSDSQSPACNVAHSWWVPELAGTRDVIPGRTNHLTLKVDPGNEGAYLGQCKEYCGLSHANMRFRVIVQSRSAFEDWLAGQQQGPAVVLA
ncbi:MAG: cytochrome c oxidase subunit II, partial [Actinobacteria bacterium]